MRRGTDGKCRARRRGSGRKEGGRFASNCMRIALQTRDAQSGKQRKVRAHVRNVNDLSEPPNLLGEGKRRGVQKETPKRADSVASWVCRSFFPRSASTTLSLPFSLPFETKSPATPNTGSWQDSKARPGLTLVGIRLHDCVMSRVCGKGASSVWKRHVAVDTCFGV